MNIDQDYLGGSPEISRMMIGQSLLEETKKHFLKPLPTSPDTTINEIMMNAGAKLVIDYLEKANALKGRL